MFVYSFKATKIKLLASVAACILLATCAILLLPDTEHSVTVNSSEIDGKIRFDGIKTVDDLVKFAENLGYSVDAVPAESVELRIPSKFDAVLEKYNDLQKSQGFNLGKYKNKTVSRYTFRVTALPDEKSLPKEDVLLTLILCGDKIIGGDLFYTGENSSVTGILK